LVASAVGKIIVKVPDVEVFAPPKSKIHTEGSPAAVSLYIIAPYAVIVALVNDKSAKSVNAVVEVEVGVTFVNAPPPAEYEPDAATSLVAVYAVVAAVKEALLSYKANLKVFPVLVVKLCTALISSTLKLVHMKFPENAIFNLLTNERGWNILLLAGELQ
jgi:hypothetical protein